MTSFLPKAVLTNAILTNACLTKAGTRGAAAQQQREPTGAEFVAEFTQWPNGDAARRPDCSGIELLILATRTDATASVRKLRDNARGRHHGGVALGNFPVRFDEFVRQLDRDA